MTKPMTQTVADIQRRLRLVEAWRPGVDAALAELPGILDRLAALEAAQEPPPSPRMLLGQAHAPATEPEFQALDTLVGVPAAIRRTYVTAATIPSTFATTPAGTDVGRRASWQSVRAPWAEVASGLWDAAIELYVASIPSDHRCLLTYSHEPENDGGNPVDFVAASRRFYEVARPAAATSVRIGPVAMGWTFDPLNHTGQRAAYFDGIGADHMDFGGLDIYQPYHFPPAGYDSRWWPAPMGRLNAFLDWCTVLGVPPAIGETACAQDTTGASGNPDGTAAKIEWVQTTVQTVEDAGGLAVCYFDTVINDDLDPSALITAQPEFTAAWAEMLRVRQ